MINEIISGVCEAISREFGKDYAVYTENTVQGAKKPCFFITCKNPKSGSVKDRYFTNKQLLGNRYLRSAGLCVEFFPANSVSDKRGECSEVLDRLFICLEYINSGKEKIRGNGMQGEFSEDMLNFFVNYDLFVYTEDEKEMMGELSVSSAAGGGNT